MHASARNEALGQHLVSAHVHNALWQAAKPPMCNQAWHVVVQKAPRLQ